jgi:hypothetical protein
MPFGSPEMDLMVILTKGEGRVRITQLKEIHLLGLSRKRADARRRILFAFYRKI